MYFEIINEIKNVKTIAIGGNIRDIMRLRKQYGVGRWRKMKGVANIRLQSVVSVMLNSICMKPTVLAEEK